MKKILILYLDNGDIKNIYKKERMWNDVMTWVMEGKSEEDIKQAKANLTQKSKRIAFGDGTMVMMIPIGQLIHDTFATHIFITDEVYDLPNGHKFATEVLMPIIAPKHNIFDWDTEGKNPQERLITFKVNSDNNLELKVFNFNRNK